MRSHLEQAISILSSQGRWIHVNTKLFWIGANILSGASWVKAMPRQSEADINYGDVIHRQRLGNVLAIDSMVEQLIQKLDDYGQLENTYIMYTTDNG